MQKKDKAFGAVEIVYGALKPLKADERGRVLASVNALLEVTIVDDAKPSQGKQTMVSVSAPTSTARPVAIRELIHDKHPKTHPQFITLFAYYREKYQNIPTFSRDSLEKYYAESRENPPSNYDRDFVTAIGKGWIHEDGENSYITSKGIEAVETSFSRESDKPPGPKKIPKTKKLKAAKKTGKK